MSITKSTIVVYPYSGSTNELTIPFDYLKRDFVVVALGGDGKPQKALRLGTDYRFATKTTIVITRQYQPDEGYNKVIVRRVTDASKRIINYQDGSILNASELNTSQLQALHVAEESRDLAKYTLFVDDNNNLDARGRKIINLGDPTNPQDAVTKKYVDTASESVIDSRNKALQYRNEAEGFRDEAEGFRDEAEGFKTVAQSSATTVISKLDDAINLNKQAIASGEKAQQYASDAQKSASNASIAEKNAKASDKNAAKSAEDAKAYADSIDPKLTTHTYNTIDELRKVSLLNSVGVAYVIGYREGSKLGGGVFVPDLQDKITQDDGGLVIVSTVGVRWKRVINSDSIDARWFGAYGDGVNDDIQYLRKAHDKAKELHKYLLLSEGLYYISETFELSGIMLKGEGPVITDPYYGKKEDGYNFITNSKSSNWSYYFNIDSGASKTWREHLVTVRGVGSAIVSDVASPIIKCNKNYKIKIESIGVVGNHRLKGQDGISFDTSNDSYKGNIHSVRNVKITGCGNNGISFNSGLEMSIISNCSFIANNGYGFYTGVLRGLSGNVLDSATDYLTFKDCSADNNRKGGFFFEMVRRDVSFENINGNNNGQYDCPAAALIDPLLSYDRNIPSTKNNFAALIEVHDSCLDKVGAYGATIGLSFDRIWGEQIGSLIKVRANEGRGILRGLTVVRCSAIASSKFSSIPLTAPNAATLITIQSKYLEDVFIENNVASSMKLLDVEGCSSFSNTQYIKGMTPKTPKEFKLMVGKVEGTVNISKLILDKPSVYEDYLQQSTPRVVNSDIIKRVYTYWAGLNVVAPICVFRIYGQHAATNGAAYGIYDLYVFRNNNGHYKGDVIKISDTSNIFTVPPSISQDGTLSYTISPYKVSRIELVTPYKWFGGTFTGLYKRKDRDAL